MDAAQSALDSLRTVEFRETLKGYHRDDVDEYLEKAAIEAEALQEQLRQAGDRLRLAGERIAELEAALKQQPAVEQAPAPRPVPAVADDTLQRTLVLAQKFVDETKADSEARAAKILADATAHARSLTASAESKAAQIAQESEGRLREDINRLEGIRGQLAADVEAMARHLESERNRLRSSLADVIKWVDDIVQPATVLVGQQGKGGSGQAPGGGARRPAPTAHPEENPGADTSGEPAQGQSAGTSVNAGTASLPLEA